MGDKNCDPQKKITSNESLSKAFSNMHVGISSRANRRFSQKFVSFYNMGSTPIGHQQIRHISKRDLKDILIKDFRIELELLSSGQRITMYRRLRRVLMSYAEYGKTSVLSLWKFVLLELVQLAGSDELQNANHTERAISPTASIMSSLSVVGDEPTVVEIDLLSDDDDNNGAEASDIMPPPEKTKVVRKAITSTPNKQKEESIDEENMKSMPETSLALETTQSSSITDLPNSSLLHATAVNPIRPVELAVQTEINLPTTSNNITHGNDPISLSQTLEKAVLSCQLCPVQKDQNQPPETPAESNKASNESAIVNTTLPVESSENLIQPNVRAVVWVPITQQNADSILVEPSSNDNETPKTSTAANENMIISNNKNKGPKSTTTISDQNDSNVLSAVINNSAQTNRDDPPQDMPNVDKASAEPKTNKHSSATPSKEETDKYKHTKKKNKRISKRTKEAEMEVSISSERKSRSASPASSGSDDQFIDIGIGSVQAMKLSCAADQLKYLQMDLINRNRIRFAFTPIHTPIENGDRTNIHLKHILNWPGITLHLNLGRVKISRSVLPNYKRSLIIGGHSLSDIVQPITRLELRRVKTNLSAEQSAELSVEMLDTFFAMIQSVPCTSLFKKSENVLKNTFKTLQIDMLPMKTVLLNQKYSHFLYGSLYSRYYLNSAESRVPTRQSMANDTLMVRLLETIHPEVQFQITECPFVQGGNDNEEEAWSQDLFEYFDLLIKKRCPKALAEFSVMFQNAFAFECTICDKQFNDGEKAIRDVTRHIRTEHSQSPNWNCASCDLTQSTLRLAENQWEHHCG